MKADHRKELQTNLLADRLSRAAHSLTQAPSRSTMIYLGLAALAVVLILTWRYFSASSEASSSERWRKLDEVIFGAQLDEFVQDKDVQGTRQGLVARFKEARRLLQDGLRDLGTRKADARQNVEKGTQAYEALLKESLPVPLLQQEALWGAAKGYEALGDLDKAKQYYERLVKEHGNSALGRDADKALARLNDEDNRRDLEDLAKEFGARE
jgi:tetratricopeptide (TPR) repeat protein